MKKTCFILSLFTFCSIYAAEKDIPAASVETQVESYLKQHHPELSRFYGIEAGLGSTMIYQGAVQADSGPQTRKDANGASYSVDLTVGKKFDDYGNVFLHLEQGNGDGVETKLNVFSNVNRDADADNNVRVTEVWYEYASPLKNIPVSIMFGKLDPTILVDDNKYANDETTKFLGRIFRNSPVIDFPDNALGARFVVEVGSFLDVSFLTIDAFDGMFYAVQSNFKPNFLSKEGNYKLIGWYNGRPHTRWSNITKQGANSYGFGVSMDQELTDVLGVFARYGWQDPDTVLNTADGFDINTAYSLWQSYSFGIQLGASFWGRSEDVLGLAFGQVFASKKYRDFVVGRQAKAESHFELYYNCKLDDHLYMSPDIQFIANPYGSDSGFGNKTIFVAGVRAQVYL